MCLILLDSHDAEPDEGPLAGLDRPLTLMLRPGLAHPPPGTGDGLRERDIGVAGVPVAGVPVTNKIRHYYFSGSVPTVRLLKRREKLRDASHKASLSGTQQVTAWVHRRGRRNDSIQDRHSATDYTPEA